MKWNDRTHPSDHVTDTSSHPGSTDSKMLLYSTLAATAGIALFTAYGMRYWRRSVQRHVQEVKEQVGQLVMTRRRRRRGMTESTATTARSSLASQLDLSSTYQQYLQKNFPQHKVMSLGEYLDSLQPVAANILPKEELDTLLAAALLRVLGPSLGSALLPALQWTPLYAKLLEKVTRTASSKTEPNVVNKEGQPIVGKAARSMPSQFVGAMSGISLTSLLGIADIAISLTSKGRQNEPSCTSNVESSSPKTSVESATPLSNDSNLLRILQHGEIEKPTFDDLSNSFIFSQQWDEAINELEVKLREASGGEYNPEEYPKVEPGPVHEILLPDLHMGAGDAIKTHTNRQIVQNRLLSILMNRLAANYLSKEVSDLTEFTVQLDPQSEALTEPAALIQALIQSGHSVTTRSSCRVTTFGFTLSVKAQDEKDGSLEWFHIPLALPLRSGIAASDGTHVPAYLMHSCIDFTISAGPLIKDDVSVEFYHNQDGFCGWISSHYTDLPWIRESVSHPLSPVRASRFSTLLAACINSVALRMNLPNGGYGSIGVCNDSAAIVDSAVRGKTHVYPITYIGSFFYQIVKRAQELVDELREQKDVPQVVLDEAEILHKTILNLPNDVHPTPSSFPETTRRILESMPEHRQFIEMEVAVQILKDEFVAS